MPKQYTRLLALLVFLPMLGFGQVAYQLSPIAHQQFLDVNGKPLAGGFVYTYSAGSSTPLATYKDNVGTANTNPIVLDAGGFATIYLSQNSYKWCVQNSSSVQQWCQDNIQNFSQTIFTSANTWTLAQTFNSWINLLGGGSDTTGGAGNLFYRTDLGCVRYYNSAWHCASGTDVTETLTNKTLTAPILTNPSTTGTDSGIETLTNKTLSGPKVDRLNSSGAAPTVAVTGFGASPTVLVETGSTDSLGSVLVTAGGAGPAATGTIALTLSAATGSFPGCVWQLSIGSANWTAGATWLVTTLSATQSIITWTNGASTNLVAASSYRAMWVCGLK